MMNKFLKLIPILLLTIGLNSYGQLNGNFKTVRLVNQFDSTAVIQQDGTIYYNLQSNTFRGRQAGTWFDLIGGSGGGVIPSNPNELLMNVGGTNQGQANLVYDAVANNLELGRLFSFTNTNYNDAFISGLAHSFGGTGEIRDPIVMGNGVQLNTFGGSIRWPAVIGESNGIDADAGVVNNSGLISGFNNFILHQSGAGFFSGGMFSGTNNTIISNDFNIGTGIILGSSNTMFDGDNSVILGGTGISGIDGVNSTIYMPQIRIGLGTGGSLPAGTAANTILSYNSTDGVVSNLPDNIVPIGNTAPGVGQDGQVLQWNNGTTSWDYVTAGGGGSGWTLGGTSNLTAPVTIDGGNLFGVTFNDWTSWTYNSASSGTEMTWTTDDTAFAVFGNDGSNLIYDDFRTYQKIGVTTLGVPAYQSSEGEFGISFQLIDDPTVNLRTQIAIEGGTSLIQNDDWNINNPTATDDIIFTDRTITPEGLKYASDYSANFVDRSIVDKAYVDGVTINVTSVQILNLATTPITLVPAQGANTIVQITSPLTIIYDFGTIAYTGGTNINVQYASGVNMAGFGGLISSGSDILSQTDVNAHFSQPLANFENTDLELIAPSAPLTGDGTLTISFTYKVINF